MITTTSSRYTVVDTDGVKVLDLSGIIFQPHLAEPLTEPHIRNNGFKELFLSFIASTKASRLILNNIDIDTSQATERFALTINLIENIIKKLPNNVTELDLSSNTLKNIGILQILHALVKSNVRKLNISNNKISYEGIIGLCLMLSNSKITSLNISRNKLGKESYNLLEKYLSKTLLVELTSYPGNKKRFDSRKLTKIIRYKNYMFYRALQAKFGSDIAKLIIENLAMNHGSMVKAIKLIEQESSSPLTFLPEKKQENSTQQQKSPNIFTS